ncbi:uncharacterized protein LOC113278368 [Papaver somniferum]|uniref:uncharacterized protein LOC113278368 n=1 Tax=Papaver somniferum TaxID=3469 RepID=UPI000E6F9F9D|nr:uncharacterized protein LOC113278368 [Papaver somniferum]
MATNGSMCLDEKKKKRSRTVVAAERSSRSKKVAADRSKLPRLSKAELEIKKEILNEKIAKLREDIENLEDLKQVLIIRIRQQNDELEVLEYMVHIYHGEY